MKVLLTGATGYIGKRLLPVLIGKGHTVVCCVRDKSRFNPPESFHKNIQVIEVDLLDKSSFMNIPDDIDGAYYLVHSMSTSKDYQKLEQLSASNFREAINNTKAVHVIYLSGIINEEVLSEHLQSRKIVEEELSKGKYHLTTLRAGIIIGSGSASFEIIRDLVEKLPVMVAPKWLLTRCQPIAIADVIKFLDSTFLNKKTFDQNYDIGGPDILTYKEMLIGFAKVRGLSRRIFTVPIMTPRLSSYWLYFITATSYKLATALVDSMKVEVLCRDDKINQILNIHPITYIEALKRSFIAIRENHIISSWKDSLVSGIADFRLSDLIEVPVYGCLIEKRSKPFKSREQSIQHIWGIGGESGWYYANWLWKLRGHLDKMIGGVGLRRGRTNPFSLAAGDAVNFWRVLYTDKDEGRLLLFAEMKLPGEAWLEFLVTEKEVIQTATFRPKGILGRLYWYMVYPLHALIFGGLLKRLTH
ncbi:MAG: SDR family oxidoreductase [Bacteroidales bacterium]|nr:SDR family oxidoreductase [Bacteroidales bacterium]MCF8405090.1 SDR family oxidoreductase [Bacteroidales bacterium]